MATAGMELIVLRLGGRGGKADNEQVKKTKTNKYNFL